MMVDVNLHEYDNGRVGRWFDSYTMPVPRVGEIIITKNYNFLVKEIRYQLDGPRNARLKWVDVLVKII